MEPRISAVTLGVADLDRSVAFYRGLGLQPEQVVGTQVAFFQFNGFVLCLYADLAADAGIPARGAGLTSLAYNVRAPGDIDAVLAAAEAAGGSVLRPTHDTDWGGRSSYFADPDGHLWEVAWNPSWPIDAEGRTSLG
ncbi:MAG: VOC family protein [Propionicimonas sp.]|nr:VOC family protein [Propionicimonas sp.]